MMRTVISWAVAVTTGMGLIAPDVAQASQPSSVLHEVMLGMGPLPGASVVGPLDTSEIETAINAYAWRMPRKRNWPIGLDERPIVDTRRKDKMVHTLESWESLGRLRTMYQRTTAQLQALNPDLDLRNLDEGDEVVVWKRDDDSVSQSRGKPQSGRLIDGEPMPDSDHYVLQYPHRTFGTHYTISETVRVLDAYYEAFADAEPLIIGDASRRNGRTLGPHQSHQSGRDIDITLPRHEPPPNYRRFYRVWPDNLDAEHTLWLMAEFIDSGYVKYIFLDWHHQRTIWELAREQGAPEEWLDEVFEYPNRGSPGIIRHSPGHDGHFHVRFHCQNTDEWCH